MINPAPALPPGALLRAATREDHGRVDAAFGRFDLGRREGYLAFLTAQARIVPRLEALLDPAALIPGWQGRSAALLQDLRELGREAPAPLEPAVAAGTGARWGALYVLEGSRLGGAFLARQIPAGFPAGFLNAVHVPGGWRDLLARLDGQSLGPAERGEAIRAARAVFAAFIAAADAAGVTPPAEPMPAS